MYRLVLRALCILSFCLLVGGATGSFTVQQASAQTPIYNPFMPTYLPTGFGYNSTINYPYSYPYGIMSYGGAYPYATSSSIGISTSSPGAYPSSSVPFTANGSTTTGPDHCDLYDSWCAYCTNNPSSDLCKSYVPVPQPSH